MQKILTKLLTAAALGLLLVACAQTYPLRPDLPSARWTALEGKKVLFKVSMESSEDGSHDCAGKLVAQWAKDQDLQDVVRTDRPLANRSLTFSNTSTFKGAQLDAMVQALARCQVPDATGVRWSTLRWTVEAVTTPSDVKEPVTMPAYKEPGVVGS